MRARTLMPLLALAGAFAASPVLAQGTARSMDIDVSIRSAGMGGASAAVFWGQDLNHWSNPALLGLLEGVRYERGKTQLVPDLADDVRFDSRVIKAGIGGIGAVWSQGAPGPGGVRLDYGGSEGTDPGGNPTGTYRSWEQVDSWGFGVSALRAVESLTRLAGGDPQVLSRFADVSFGMNWKDVGVHLAPGVGGETRARDWGVLVRATPLNLLESDGSLPLRLDVAWGHSVLSANDDAAIAFIGPDLDRVSRHRRDGFSGRIAFSPPSLESAANARSPRGALLRGFLPLLSIGGAWERATIDAGSGTRGYRTRGGGGEVDIANVFAVRIGTYSDRTGDIEAGTSGWSLGLPVGPWAGFRFTHATFPEASGLSDLERDGWSVWVNPFAIVEQVRQH